MIPYGRQDIVQADIDAVVGVLRSDFLTQGPMVPRFERTLAQKVRASHAVAVNSATSALHIACLALRLGEGDRLWTVPNSFVASANCGRYCGSDVDFVDIDAGTWNISVRHLREKLAKAKLDGRLPKVLVPVHLGGQPTEQEAIWALSQEYGFKVVEDASHSVGASRNGEPVGSCHWSHITVFSFHPVKIMTSGEGGMALTNDEDLAERMRRLRSHGITRDPAHIRHDKPIPSWYYEQQMLGFNYRMTDIQAALGLSQFERVGDNVDTRNELANRYDAGLKDMQLQRPTVRTENRSAFHLYIVRLSRDVAAAKHRQVFDSLREAGIGVNLHYMPIHLQPYYRDLGFSAGQFPEAEAYGNSAITLPLYPKLTVQDQDTVIEALKAAL